MRIGQVSKNTVAVCELFADGAERSTEEACAELGVTKSVGRSRIRSAFKAGLLEKRVIGSGVAMWTANSEGVRVGEAGYQEPGIAESIRSSVEALSSGPKVSSEVASCTKAPASVALTRLKRAEALGLARSKTGMRPSHPPGIRPWNRRDIPQRVFEITEAGRALLCSN